MIKLPMTALACLTLFASFLHAQSAAQPERLAVSGTWFGDFTLTAPDGTVSHNTAVMIFEQHGAGLAGSVGPTVDQQSPFTDGRVDGQTVAFHLDAAGGLDFTLRSDHGHLMGTATGKSAKATIDVRPAPGLLPHAKLVEEIMEADRALFHAFDTCDAAGYASFLSKDLEFYHDHTGKTGYEDNLRALRNRCAEGIQLRRELVEGSLVVNAVPGYGAIEAGVHRFYSLQKDGSEHLDATAQFSEVWSKETGDWKLVRVLSFDHR
ncbi:MAG: nuclear transport factor 2 family protein [Acidobacteriaceae bacterium]